MRTTMLMLLVVVSVAQAGVKTVNPVDRWMPSGVIEFNWERQGTDNGRPYAWTSSGTLTFSKDRALFERHTINGEPLRPEKVDPNARYAKDLMLQVTPQGSFVYAPGQPTIIFQPGQLTDVNGLSMLTNGVVPGFVMSAISEGPDHNIVVSTPAVRWHMTTDEQDRIVEMSSQTDKIIRSCRLAGHIQLPDGKWAASEVSSACHTDTQDITDYLQLRFRPGNPTVDELTIPVSEGVKILETYTEGQELKLRPMSTVGQAPIRKLNTLHSYFCDVKELGGCTVGWYDSCCQGGCNPKSRQLLPHCHCIHTETWAVTCDWWWNVAYVEWDCITIQYPVNWCPGFPYCYPDGTTTKEYLEDVCEVG